MPNQMKRNIFYLFLLMGLVLTKTEYVLNTWDPSINPETFNESLQRGRVLIEFYQPACVKCTRLTTLLIDLKARVESKSNNITIGTIDCSKQKEFCTNKSITGYPSLVLYENGAKPRKLSNHLDLWALLKALNMYSALKCTPGYVHKLEPHDFQESISQGTHFIKFYKPSCAHCRLFAPTWIQLAREMKDYTNVCITEFNCESKTGFCYTLGVNTVPTLIWFENGTSIRQYKGSQNLRTLIEFTEEMVGYEGNYRSGGSAVQQWSTIFVLSLIITL